MSPHVGLSLHEGLNDSDDLKRYTTSSFAFKSKADGVWYLIECREDNWVYDYRGSSWLRSMVGKSIHKHPNRQVVEDLRKMRNRITQDTFADDDAKIDEKARQVDLRPLLRWYWNPWDLFWIGVCIVILLAWVMVNMAFVVGVQLKEIWRDPRWYWGWYMQGVRRRIQPVWRKCAQALRFHQ